jgi:RNA polymerase sigma factor (TIGR02999 family)
MTDVTRILNRVQEGDPKAADELLPLVYDELRKLAGAKMAAQPPGHTLQPTALVHEAYLRLVGSEQGRWHDSRHFLAAATEAMRQILIDAARKKHRLKRGGGWTRLNLEDIQIAVETDPENLLKVDEALEQFAIGDPEKAQLVKLRFFAGLSLSQAAQVMGISLATAKRYWVFSKAWLYRYITRSE